MDRLSFDEAALRRLSAIPAAAHQEHVALEVLRAAWRRRRQVAGMAMAAAVLGFGFAATRPPHYPAEAMIELQVGRAPPNPSGDSNASVVVEAASIVLGEVRIMRSRMVAQRVVEKLGLADDPAFTGQSFTSRVSHWLARLITREPAETAAEQHAQRAAIAEKRLMTGLSIETDNRSYLISVTYTASDPDMAARIANAVADEYLSSRLENNQAAAKHTAEWLTGQITATEAQLRTTENSILALRGQMGRADLGGQGDSIEQQRLRDFASQLNAVTVSRIAEEGRLARILSLVQSGSAVSTPELQAMPQVSAASQKVAQARRDLSDLLSRLGPKHPDVIQAQSALADAETALSTEIDQAVIGLRANLETTRSTERAMQARLETMQRSLINDLGQETQLRAWQATAASLRDRLVALMRNRDQALALQDLRVVPASLIVPAQPSRQPADLSPMLVGFLAMIGGLLAGIASAAVLERFDRGLRTSDDVTATTDLRCLGLIPELPGNDPLVKTPDRPALTVNQVMFDEAMHLVASSVGLFGSSHKDSGRIVLVTSAVEDEGRSTLCSGLARSLVASGRRVLLINGPPRRFGPAPPVEPAPGPGREPSTIPDRVEGTLQSNNRTRAEIVVLHRNMASSLSLDVLGSPQLATALEQARKHFDVILVEGPPVLLVADALVLGRMADTVIHAARWADTKRRLVRSALRRMQDHGILADGVVLTRVDVDKHADLGLADRASLHLRRHSYHERGINVATARLSAELEN